jgi:hypothetical protein
VLRENVEPKAVINAGDVFARPLPDDIVSTPPLKAPRCKACCPSVWWTRAMPELANRLLEWQWPRGRWNCDPIPAAHAWSIFETAHPRAACNTTFLGKD